MNTEMILKADAALHIDVTCYGCKRTVALSNTTESDGRRYCLRCPITDPSICFDVARCLLREIHVEYMNKRINLPFELQAKIVNLLGA